MRIIERELFNENIEFYFPKKTNYNLTIGELKEIIRRELIFRWEWKNKKVYFYGFDICTNNNVMKADFINIKVIDHIYNNSVNLAIDIYGNLQE